MITRNDNDEEPVFRMRYVQDKSVENSNNYWEQYDALKKTWFRLCNECIKKVCKSSDSLCLFHYNKTKKSKTMKKKIKRLNTKRKKKNNKRKIPLKMKVEEIVKDEDEEMDESLGIVISISSTLSKKQIAQVKEFITKFHNNSQSIQFTCESQPEYIDDTTTHVITNDVGSFTTTLTKQIIQACVRHIFISSIDWIISSIEQSSILDHFPYEILRDKKSLKNSRGIKQCRFDQLPVFPSSCIISVECHTDIKQMKMTRDELIEIIELSGATLLNDYIQYKTLIILCNTKKDMINRKKQNDEKFIYYCKPAFLFDSIVRHEVQSIDKYLCAIVRSVRISFDLIENKNENTDILNYFSQQIVYLHLCISYKLLDLKKFSNLRSFIINTKLTKKQLDLIHPNILPHLTRLTFSEQSKDKESLNKIIFNENCLNEENLSWLKVYHLPLLPNYFLINSLNLPHIQTMIFDRLTSYDIHLILSLQITLRRLKANMVSWIRDDAISKINSSNKNYQHKHLIELDNTKGNFRNFHYTR